MHSVPLLSTCTNTFLNPWIVLSSGSPVMLYLCWKKGYQACLLVILYALFCLPLTIVWFIWVERTHKIIYFFIELKHITTPIFMVWGEFFFTVNTDTLTFHADTIFFTLQFFFLQLYVLEDVFCSITSIALNNVPININGNFQLN